MPSLDLWVKVENGQVVREPGLLPPAIKNSGADKDGLILSGWYPVVSIKPETVDLSIEKWESQTFDIKSDHVVWTLTKRAKTQEELDEENAERWRLWRIERNFRLAETDWMIIKCAEAGEQVPAAWAAYRQALRDLPLQTDFNGIDWPVKPV